MNEKNTDTLQQELMSTNNLDRFLTENDASFRDVPLQEAIQLPSNSWLLTITCPFRPTTSSLLL